MLGAWDLRRVKILSCVETGEQTNEGNKAVELGSVENPVKVIEFVARIPSCTIFTSIA